MEEVKDQVRGQKSLKAVLTKILAVNMLGEETKAWVILILV